MPSATLQYITRCTYVGYISGRSSQPQRRTCCWLHWTKGRRIRNIILFWDLQRENDKQSFGVLHGAARDDIQRPSGGRCTSPHLACERRREVLLQFLSTERVGYMHSRVHSTGTPPATMEHKCCVGRVIVHHANDTVSPDIPITLWGPAATLATPTSSLHLGMGPFVYGMPPRASRWMRLLIPMIAV
ncbi:wd-40 repeat protein [Moniliophthora roreri]|nr:wd-40 repeat protein [Moniliophthora roreri]